MKRTLFLAVVIFSFQIGIAQESNIKKHEIGVNLYGYNNAFVGASNDYEYYLMYATQQSYLNGLSYKYHHRNHAFRFSAQYQYEKLPDQGIDGNYDPNQLYWGEIYNIEGRLGFEYLLGKGKLHPLLITDAVFSYGYTNGQSGAYIGPTISPITHEIKSYSFGVSPGAGVAYQLLSMLSFRLETNINIGYYQQKGKPIYGYSNASFGTYSEGAYFIYNPISTLSVIFHF